MGLSYQFFVSKSIALTLDDHKQDFCSSMVFQDNACLLDDQLHLHRAGDEMFGSI
jgi:hypothetical protein